MAVAMAPLDGDSLLRRRLLCASASTFTLTGDGNGAVAPVWWSSGALATVDCRVHSHLHSHLLVAVTPLHLTYPWCICVMLL